MSTPDRMQALILYGPGQLRLETVPSPQPEPGGVIVRVHESTICGTDVRILDGTKTREVRPGHPIGHEFAGTIAAVGSGVTDYQVGDRVAVCVVVSCGECSMCRANKENLCPKRRTIGYHTDGAFAEYVPIPAQAVARGNLFRLDDDFGFETAPAIEPLGCCINGWHEMNVTPEEARSRPPERLVIFGAGPIGLMHLSIAKAGGVTPQRIDSVTVVEPLEHRRGYAKQLGADETCHPDEFDAVEAYDSAILAIGDTSAVNQAIRSLRSCGKLSLFAGFDRGASVTIDPNVIHYRQLRVSGGSESRRRDYAQALELVRTGRLDLSRVISHRFSLADHEQAFDIATNRIGRKVGFEIVKE